MGRFDEINRFVQEILRSATEGKKKSVYRDEPIVFPASQMKSYTPPRYRQMRELLNSRDLLYKSSAEIFYLQGKFMEDMEDFYTFDESFVRYFPTYRELNLHQLRGYFSWRTKVRKGERSFAPIPFQFLYIYELLNLIGVSTPEEGYTSLLAFYKQYGGPTSVIARYGKPWLTDFVVYYGLDPRRIPDMTEMKYDAALSVLIDYKQKTPQEVRQALDVFSSYKLAGSAFFKQYPADTDAVMYRLYGYIFEYYEKHSKSGAIGRLFGSYERYPHTMFASAVFYEKEKHADATVEISPLHRYFCRGGQWECERFLCRKDKAGKLGVLLKSADFHLRKVYHFPHPLKPIECPKFFSDAIEKAVREFLTEKRKKQAPVIHIDRSKLKAIRDTSEITRDKLIVEEEAAEPLPTRVEEAPPAKEWGLSAVETAVLRALLSGEDASAAAGAHGKMLSLVIDSLNETLFDQFADTVITFEDDRPVVIEDYETKLKGMLNL